MYLSIIVTKQYSQHYSYKKGNTSQIYFRDIAVTLLLLINKRCARINTLLNIAHVKEILFLRMETTEQTERIQNREY